MNISIKTTNFNASAAIKQYVNAKVSKLERYFDNLISAKIELEQDRHHKSGDVYRAEATILTKGKVLRAEASSEDMYASIDLMIPKLKEQITKLRDKRITLSRRGARSAKKRR